MPSLLSLNGSRTGWAATSCLMAALLKNCDAVMLLGMSPDSRAATSSILHTTWQHNFRHRSSICFR